jgi:hypothetical protein
MATLIKGLPVLRVVCAAVLILLTFPVATAPADKNGASEASEPKNAGKDDGGKPDENAKEGMRTPQKTRASLMRPRPARRLRALPLLLWQVKSSPG